MTFVVDVPTVSGKLGLSARSLYTDLTDSTAGTDKANDVTVVESQPPAKKKIKMQMVGNAGLFYVFATSSTFLLETVIM